MRVGQERRRFLTLGEVLAIGADACRGLAFAHAARDENGRSMGLVHRDVSPHNIMVSRSGTAKVMDFGIAKAAERLTRTKTGMIKGKVAYMAPEQGKSGDVDRRADVFSLAVTLWELTTDRRLFKRTLDWRTLY